jgi:hypothetical protein
MQTLKQFIAKNKIRMSADWADSNPNMAADDKWMASARHFRCVLRRGSKQLTIPFSQGLAHEQEPTAADVLSCLASDSSGIENARSFEDWCNEYGYDIDSRKAEKTYQVCRKQREKLESFLGTTAFEDLVRNTETL